MLQFNILSSSFDFPSYITLEFTGLGLDLADFLSQFLFAIFFAPTASQIKEARHIKFFRISFIDQVCAQIQGIVLQFFSLLCGTQQSR